MSECDAILKVHGHAALAEVTAADGRAPEGALGDAVREAILRASSEARARTLYTDGDYYLDLQGAGCDASLGVRAIGAHLSSRGFIVKVVETVTCPSCESGPEAEDCSTCDGRGFTPGAYLACG
ncbi:MAG: hypothetical protein Q8S73_36415 [Deltaproteobacteria bacterium]|nr:hypothetical protein [Myxococcales bacterium]MDP3219643.1 hypothetical protein [Deltaproteobacteria bacterium]